MEPGWKDLILNQALDFMCFWCPETSFLVILKNKKVCALNQPQAVYATVAMSLF